MDDQFREDLEAFFFNVRVVFGEAVGEVGGGVDAGLGGGEGASDVVVEVAGGGGGGGVGCSGEERFVHYLMCVCFCSQSASYCTITSLSFFSWLLDRYCTDSFANFLEICVY